MIEDEFNIIWFVFHFIILFFKRNFNLILKANAIMSISAVTHEDTNHVNEA